MTSARSSVLSFALARVFALALVQAGCAGESSGAEQGPVSAGEESGAGESAPSSSALTSDGWGDSLEEGEESGCEDCPDREGEPCISLYQDCGQGLKCVPYWLPEDLGGAPTDYKCVRAEGSLPAGSPCTLADLESALDDCDPGSFCWTWGGAQPGRCQALCMGGFQYADCIEGWTCVLPEASPPMCVEPCDPLVGVVPEPSCPAGTQCGSSVYGDTCVVEGAQLSLGEPCEPFNDCQAGLGCAPTEQLLGCAGAACCAALCAVAEGDAPCVAIDPAYVCVPRSEEPEEAVGTCRLPA